MATLVLKVNPLRETRNRRKGERPLRSKQSAQEGHNIFGWLARILCPEMR